MYSEWNVWDMTNGDEFIVKAEGIEDFSIPGLHTTWIQLDSKYDMLDEKWYFYFREIENFNGSKTKRILRVDKK